jgi:hypothetical protein
MTIEIDVRDFDPSIHDVYAQLFPDDEDKSRASLEWRFASNPHGPPKFVIATVDGEVAGMIALAPTRVTGLPDCGHVYQAIDGIVDPRFRGRDLFFHMGSAVNRPELHGAGLVWGFPNAKAAPRWFGRLGWSNLGYAPLMMRPLRTGFLLSRIHPALGRVDLPLPPRRESVGSAYSDIGAVAADAGRLWARIRKDYGVAVDRTSDWLRWRLSEKPGYEYRCVATGAADEGASAFVATKIARKHGRTICYVMEAFSAENDGVLLSRLLKSELSHALSCGAELALAWCPPSAPSFGALSKAGFVRVPARLRPIETHFGACALQGACSAAAAPGARWYISFLDSDTN